jgi:hypothetical protein
MSNKSKHTPGPWTALPDKEGWTIQSGQYRVCEVPNVNHFPQNEANARLIAAAPDLLEALGKITAYAEAHQFDFLAVELDYCPDWVAPYRHIADTARAALAKAQPITAKTPTDV